MIRLATCYMCDNPATSSEHAPPKCLFPDWRAGLGDFRKQLITVPSCDEHNSLKSSDDEFLMVSLAGIFGNNRLGYLHRLGKVNRAVLRSSEKLLDAVFKERTSRYARVGDRGLLQLIWGTVDTARLQRCFDRVARALHVHHFGTRFDGATRSLVGYLEPKENNAKAFRDFLRHRASLDLAAKPRLGANPEVFYYRVADPDEFGLYLFELCFYEGLSVYTVFMPASVRIPTHLPSLLIEKGLHTVLTLENRAYEFNRPQSSGQDESSKEEDNS